MEKDLLKEALCYYPSSSQVDAWANDILAKHALDEVDVKILDFSPITQCFGNNPNTLENKYIEFKYKNKDAKFFGYWQPSLNNPAPLLIHLPGYGSSITMHPQLSDWGYNILHISPLGYVEPDFVDKERELSPGIWPVLDKTARGEPGGYEDWLLDVLTGIFWAKKQKEVLEDRVSIYGTSQGGGTALLTASILKDYGIRCVGADLPFLTNIPMSGLEGSAYSILKNSYIIEPKELFWNRVGFIDTASHIHRLNIPVMLSAGGEDDTCPAETIIKLYEQLSCTKQITFLKDQIHTHSRSSMYLFGAWFKMFA